MLEALPTFPEGALMQALDPDLNRASYAGLIAYQDDEILVQRVQDPEGPSFDETIFPAYLWVAHERRFFPENTLSGIRAGDSAVISYLRGRGSAHVVIPGAETGGKDYDPVLERLISDQAAAVSGAPTAAPSARPVRAKARIPDEAWML
ncbi:hypothetical protein [Thiomonas sp.]